MNNINYINGEYVITHPILRTTILFSRDSVNWAKQKKVEDGEFSYPYILSFAQHNGVQVVLIGEDVG